MKRVLITGAGGFVGSRVLQQWQGKYELCAFPKGFLCNYLPGISALSEGTRTILLTVLISGTAAVLFPVNPDEQEAEHDA